MTLDCKICFESAQHGKQAKITACGHVFCEDCATRWFESQTSCPVCRREINVSANELISVYDQDVGDQGQQGSSIAMFLSSRLSAVQIHDESHSQQRGPDTVANEAASGSSSHDGFEEDVQVKFVLGKVAGRWQQLMVERAQLKSEIGSLREKNQSLLAEVEVLLHIPFRR